MGTKKKQRDRSPKGLCELLGADRFVAVLQFVENPLQRQGNALAGVVALRRHHVHRLEMERRRQRSALGHRGDAEELSGF